MKTLKKAAAAQSRLLWSKRRQIAEPETRGDLVVRFFSVPFELGEGCSFDPVRVQKAIRKQAPTSMFGKSYDPVVLTWNPDDKLAFIRLTHSITEDD